MVEGPGATRNSFKSSRLINAKVRHLSSTNTYHNNSTWWADRKLSEVIKIGKEVFLIFSRCLKEEKNEMTEQSFVVNDDNLGDLSVRLHFGMSGSLQVTNLTTAPRRARNGSNDYVATLEITFETKILRTYQTTVSITIPAKIPRTKFDKLATHDICSPTFNINHVLEQLRQHLASTTTSSSSNYNNISSLYNNSMISDILLNQSILPGIGNVIKIEGLHDARIHPKRILSSISEDELTRIILCCRTYAMKWLNDGRAPTKRVYNQAFCRTCGGTIVICRVGGTQRTTFWCVNCVGSTALHSSSSTNLVTADNGQHPNNNDSIKDQHHIMMSNNNKAGDNYRMYGSKVCPTHGPSSIILRRCQKKGNNEQRIFYTCQEKGCNFFCWADLNFPTCTTCGKRSILRISKTDKTGGNWFFICSKKKMMRGSSSSGKENGCEYFLWADKTKYLNRFGHLLTPLL